MDKRMMDLGGDKKRLELFKMVNTSQAAAGISKIDLGGASYTEEEKKVAMYGEKGQGDYLADAKRNKQKWKSHLSTHPITSVLYFFQFL